MSFCVRFASYACFSALCANQNARFLRGRDAHSSASGLVLTRRSRSRLSPWQIWSLSALPTFVRKTENANQSGENQTKRWPGAPRTLKMNSQIYKGMDPKTFHSRDWRTRRRQGDGGACSLDEDAYLEGMRWVARCVENLAPVGTGCLLARVHNGPLFHKLLQAHSRSPTFPGVGVSAAPYLAGVRRTQKAATAAARRRRSTSRLEDDLGSKRSTRRRRGGILLHYCVKGERRERGRLKCKVSWSMERSF